MPFEYLVRPFEARDRQGRIIIPSVPGGKVERSTLTWGAKTGPTSLPTPRSIGVNLKCCNETLSEETRSGNTTKITANNDPDSYIMVHRATEVKLQKQDKKDCDKWLSQNSYVASGVEQAFSDMSSLIHASDSDFLPSGTDPKCHQTMKLQPNTTAG